MEEVKKALEILNKLNREGVSNHQKSEGLLFIQLAGSYKVGKIKPYKENNCLGIRIEDKNKIFTVLWHYDDSINVTYRVKPRQWKVKAVTYKEAITEFRLWAEDLYD